MVWFLVIVAAPVLLLLLFLCLPLTARLSINNASELIIAGEVRWAFKQLHKVEWAPFAPQLVHQREPSVAKPAEPRPPEKPEAEYLVQDLEKKQKKVDKKLGGLPIPWATIKELLRTYAPRVWRALNFRCESAHFQLSVSDPALFGWIYGFMGATQWPPAPVNLHVELAAEPDLQVDLRWRVRIYPVQCLWLALSLAWEPAIRHIWWNKLFKKGEKKRGKPKSTHRTARKPHFQQDSNRRSHLSG